MSPHRGYLVIPKLVEQPTWGGYYIAKIKGWSNESFGKTKFGQSYELYSGSFLSLTTDTTQGDFIPEIEESPHQTIPIRQLIAPDPRSVLGKNSIEQYGEELKTLIKFTQAKGNSFQVHIKPENQSEQWHAKPESWYFFEDGLATIGIRDSSMVEAYKQACITIDTYVHSMSEAVTKEQMTIEEAREKIQAFIAGQDIYQYVNTVDIPSESVVDLHTGGTHHSWEEDDKKIPLGNIVYEVQVDEMDPISTMRSFDKGKIQDDGSFRKVQIEDYFVHLDTASEANTPDGLIGLPRQIHASDECTVKQLFDTKYYRLQMLDISAECSNEYMAPKEESFHHLFVKSGSVEYDDGQVQLSVGTGHSIFVPSSVAAYTITPTSHTATILKTYI